MSRSTAVVNRVIKAYDVRGLVGEEIDESLVTDVGAAFARLMRAEDARQVAIGYDMRDSSPALAAAFAAGVTAQGLDVVRIGLASTDQLYFASGLLDIPGAMFTASHNPAAYNGIKLCLAGARPVGQDTGLAEIKALAAEALSGPRGPVPDDLGKMMERADLIDEFATHVRSFVDPGVLRPLRVVADTANGMGGLVVPRVFAGLPFDLEVLFAELDGSFPNHPADPIQPENLEALRQRVTTTGADVGLAFDGDADRVFLVDEKGEPLSGSLTTSMVAAAMLDNHPGATV